MSLIDDLLLLYGARKAIGVAEGLELDRRAERQELNDKIDELKDQLASQNYNASQLLIIKLQLDELKERNRLLERKLKELKERLDEEHGALIKREDNYIFSLDKELISLEQEQRVMKDRLYEAYSKDDDIEGIDEVRTKMEERLEEIEKKIYEVQCKRSQAVHDRAFREDHVDDELYDLRSEAEEIENELESMDNEMDDLQNDIDDLEYQ